VGVVLGFLASQLLAALAGVIRNPTKLERVTGLEVSAIVPRSPEQSEMETERRRHFLVAEAFGSSVTSESLRSLRTAVLFSMSQSEMGRALLVTSATPAQGKSFVSSNLAYLLASGGKTVLLIDSDIRRRSISEYFDIPQEGAGLTDVLTGLASPAACVIKDVYPNLSILGAGVKVRNPGDLFTRPELASALEWAQKNYDFVVIDSAPLLLVNDASEIAKHSSSILFVVRQNEATAREVVDALAFLRRVGASAPGLVFNGYAPTRLRYGYRYGYGYGYGYGNYGYGGQGHHSQPNRTG
jgi:tyrosine-protein kinase Etk/Wzc